MRSFIQLCSLLFLVSCVSGQAPQMERKVKVWNGAPEESGICRMSTADLAPKLDTVKFILKAYHQGTTERECIPASSEQFKDYAAITFDDLGVLYDYIQTLNLKCEKWAE